MRTALIVTCALIATCAGYTIYWQSTADEIRGGINRWAEERRAKGWTVELGVPSVRGFPLRLELFIQTPILASPGNQWRWEMPNASASARPWALTNIKMSVPGIHKLKTEGQAMVFTLARANGGLQIRSGKPRFFAIRLAGLEWVQKNGVTTSIDTLSLHVEDAVSFNAQSDNPTKGIIVSLDAGKMVLPGAWNLPLGNGLGRLSFDAVITGLLDPRGTLPEALSRWSNAGGAIELRSFGLNWEALSLRGEGTIALDENLQPQGAITAEIDGVEKLTDALIAAGVINARTAFAAKIVNNILSFDGGSARLPISIQRQRLYLGPVPLFRLKPVRWKQLYLSNR